MRLLCLIAGLLLAAPTAAQTIPDAELRPIIEDIRKQTNDAENALGRALRRLDALQKRIASITPLPSTPLAAPVPAGTLDTIVTRSGHWQLFALPAQGDAAVYAMTLAERPTFRREFACRPLATKERGSSTALDIQTVTLLGKPATVAQGACRIVQNMTPVAPNPLWIREAVAAHVIPAYRRERAWLPALFKPLAADPKRGAYDPASLGPRSDGQAPTSNSNYVGVTSSQGGEYAASRGFLHDVDAKVIDAALHGEDALIAAYWQEFEQLTLYSLAQPQGAAWSAVNHVTADPQMPLAGDRPYETPIWVTPNPAVDSMADVEGWGRDVAHLENTGFVHWLATEDPIAGLVVQRQAAYALAGWYENYRKPTDTAYRGGKDQERGMFNTLSALWKSLKVAEGAQTANGRLIWNRARAEKQAADVIADYATYAAGVNPYLRTFRSLFGSTRTGAYAMEGGATATLTATSAFELAQYGKEPLWLWAKAGNPIARAWLAAAAEQVVARLGLIGGTAGVDGIADTRGSSYPIGPTAIDSAGYVVPKLPPPFTDLDGWARWFMAQPFAAKPPRDSFDGASVHTAVQMEAVLLLAADAGVQGLGTTLEKIAAARAATTSLRYPEMQMAKHMAAPR